MQPSTHPHHAAYCTLSTSPKEGQLSLFAEQECVTEGLPPPKATQTKKRPTPRNKTKFTSTPFSCIPPPGLGGTDLHRSLK